MTGYIHPPGPFTTAALIWKAVVWKGLQYVEQKLSFVQTTVQHVHSLQLVAALTIKRVHPAHIH
jgi:hypothetical protein